MIIDAARPPRPSLAELWRCRDLLYFLTWRELTVRYRQTALGVLWAVLQPFLTMVVFSIFLGRLAGVPSDGIPYPVFAYLGLLPWTYFAGAVTRGASSLASNASLLTRVYFPRVLLPVSAVLSAFADFAVAFTVLAGLMLWYRIPPVPGAVLLLPLAVLTAVTATGVGMGLAALNVRYRDVQHAIPFLMQVWMFATPVVYPSSLVPEGWRWPYAVNPLTGQIEAYRAAVMGRAVDWPALAVSAAGAVVLAAIGAWVFHRAQRTLADVV